MFRVVARSLLLSSERQPRYTAERSFMREPGDGAEIFPMRKTWPQRTAEGLIITEFFLHLPSICKVYLTPTLVSVGIRGGEKDRGRVSRSTWCGKEGTS